jgi:hypothetical protein
VKLSYYGISDQWSMTEKRKMEIYFLKKAFKIHQGEGERQIFRDDILKVGQ